MDLVLIPEKFHGHFYESDCYLLLSVSEKNPSEAFYVNVFCCEKIKLHVVSVRVLLSLVAELCLFFVSQILSGSTLSSLLVVS